MLLLRHAQSAFNAIFNATRVDPGIPDPQLTEIGRRQAEAAARALESHDIRRLVVSPYLRALETAEIIAAHLGLPIAIEPLVRERAHFICDIGSPRSVLAERFPHLDFSRLEERWWPDLDESEELLHRRCRRFRAAALETDDWPTTAVVSHWAFIRGLTGHELRNGELLRFDPAAPEL
jgi:broad specificity phosphatase PhoE